MIEPTSPEHANKCLRLSGPTYDAAKAYLDGYCGIDNSRLYPDREFYDLYWLKGSEYKDSELKIIRKNRGM